MIGEPLDSKDTSRELNHRVVPGLPDVLLKVSEICVTIDVLSCNGFQKCYKTSIKLSPNY